MIAIANMVTRAQSSIPQVKSPLPDNLRQKVTDSRPSLPTYEIVSNFVDNN